ncbi:restriction endonuclease subunit S [Pseudoalteromonas ruthenica]|uniref:restriction endonuclease subunit S n=1 Tax=Pseudoalteromonas ruthenica TaxID=151081 RepID=UPI00241CE3E8|nr:restriction endonuclease subunit S [Pseudoalteromonas ruthenica]|tara:strand:+ start:43178 stop:44527 length:1350 start_codon:yes stop_codon:yes gene_type:complete
MANKVRIGEVVSLSQGFAVNSKSKHLMGDNGLPLLRITDLINGTEAQYLTEETAPEKCIATEDEIIFTRTGQVGLVFRGRKGVVHNNCFKVIPNKQLLEPDYLYWFLKQPHIVKLANDIASGSVQKDLNHSAFKSIEIDLLSLEEQVANTRILNLIEEKIQLNRKTNQTLEQMAQAVFKSWFVDFDPVIDNALAAGNDIPDALQHKAEQRAIYKEKAQQLPGFAPLPDGLPQEMRTLFPSEFEQTGDPNIGIAGWIPKGWKVKTIGSMNKVNPESWTKKNAPESVKYVDLANAKNGTILGAADYTFEEAPSRARRVLRQHDIIIGVVRPANRSFAYVNENGLTGSTGFAVVRALNESYRAFTYLSLTNDDSITEFARIADGAAYPAIKPEDVINAFCVYSSDEILKRFEDLAGKFLLKKAANEKQLKPLAEIRDSLLPKLISGELQLQE